MKLEPHERLIVAIDGTTLKEAEKWVKLLHKEVSTFQVGLPLYTAVGPDVVKMVRSHGARVFLDLKYHDIPSTVAKAVYIATKFGAYMINVHAAGGHKMLGEAIAASRDAAGGKTPPIMLAVTVLTSMESLGDIGIQYEVREQVVRLATLARQEGYNGVVASPLELVPIRKACGGQFIIITPGIRPLGSRGYDQKRIAGPRQAIEAGADYLVIGRPITEQKNPLSVVKALISEIGAANS
jgi:orotidine-5'-phosphate decarboxylase